MQTASEFCEEMDWNPDVIPDLQEYAAAIRLDERRKAESVNRNSRNVVAAACLDPSCRGLCHVGEGFIELLRESLEATLDAEAGNGS